MLTVGYLYKQSFTGWQLHQQARQRFNDALNAVCFCGGHNPGFVTQSRSELIVGGMDDYLLVYEVCCFHLVILAAFPYGCIELEM